MAETNRTTAVEDVDVLHYLPPGWTEEKYGNATDEDFENLPDDVSSRLLNESSKWIFHCP
jgi:hypothetical protein